MRRIILASGSPRRKEILSKLDIPFEIDSSDIEEVTTKTKPEEIVQELSLMKVKDIAKKYLEEVIVIGADTMVALGEQVLGKPKDREDAFQMLQMLSNKKHQVYTGVSVVIKEKEKDRLEAKVISFVEKSDVWVNALTEEEINRYIDSKEPFDKAGAYGIQGKFAIHIGRIEGDFNTIVGFPIARLYEELKKEGIYL